MGLMTLTQEVALELSERTPSAPRVPDELVPEAERELMFAAIHACSLAVKAIEASGEPEWFLSYFLEAVDAELGESMVRAVRRMVEDRLAHGGW